MRRASQRNFSKQDINPVSSAELETGKRKVRKSSARWIGPKKGQSDLSLSSFMCPGAEQFVGNTHLMGSVHLGDIVMQVWIGRQKHFDCIGVPD